MWERARYAPRKLDLRSSPTLTAAGEAVLDDGVDLMGDLSEGPAAAPLLTDFCIAGIFANKNQRMASS